MNTPNNHVKRYDPPAAAHSAISHTSPLAHSLLNEFHDTTVVVKKVAQNPVVLAS